MMAKHTRNFTCDRCGEIAKADVIDPTADWVMPEGWTNALYSDAELCPVCSRALVRWFEDPAKEATP